MLKPGLDRRELLHDYFEAILVGFFQIDASKAKVSQGVLDRAATGFVRIGRERGADVSIGALQAYVL